MRTTKLRLTVTIDPALVRAGNDAVAAGRAESLSAWVNAALAERAVKERRLLALAGAVAAYESAHGEISAEELAAQLRTDRTRSIVVRGRAPGPIRRTRRKSAA